MPAVVTPAATGQWPASAGPEVRYQHHFYTVTDLLTARIRGDNVWWRQAGRVRHGESVQFRRRSPNVLRSVSKDPQKFVRGEAPGRERAASDGGSCIRMPERDGVPGDPSRFGVDEGGCAAAVLLRVEADDAAAELQRRGDDRDRLRHPANVEFRVRRRSSGLSRRSTTGAAARCAAWAPSWASSARMPGS
jgi:hypothetical protein